LVHPPYTRLFILRSRHGHDQANHGTVSQPREISPVPARRRGRRDPVSAGRRSDIGVRRVFTGLDKLVGGTVDVFAAVFDVRSFTKSWLTSGFWIGYVYQTFAWPASGKPPYPPLAQRLLIGAVINVAVVLAIALALQFLTPFPMLTWFGQLVKLLFG
jgi:hypothetical protein